jgi:hypothetical protein
MKRLMLWAAFAATMFAIYFAPEADDGAVVAPARATQSASREARPASAAVQGVLHAIDLKIYRRLAAEEEQGNLFASRNWSPPPKPVEKLKEAAAPQPPPPEAPPLPFRFLGRMVDNGKISYFLQWNDRNLVMHAGESVDGTYVLEGESGGGLTFTYVPLNQKQTLVVGEVN